MRQILVGLAVGAVASGVVSAQVIESRAPSLPINQGFFANIDASSPQMLADSFVIDSMDHPLGIVLGRVNWWGYVSDNVGFGIPKDLSEIEGFQIDVFLGDGAGGTPGTLVQSNAISILDVDASFFGGSEGSFVGGQAYALGANLPIPVILAPDVTYWLAINADVSGNALADGLFSWMETGSAIPDGLVGAKNTGSWFIADLGSSLAFSIEQLFDTDGDGLPDSVEIALANDPDPDMALPCLSPTNPDSDGDGLLDGEELFGSPKTNPCDPDTDGDNIPDGLDPFPADPDGNEGFIESKIRNTASNAGSPGLLEEFTGNGNAAAGRQGALSAQLQSAAKKAGQGDIAGAIDKLESILLKLDGDPSPPDWMEDGAARDTIVAEIELEILLLSFLLF